MTASWELTGLPPAPGLHPHPFSLLFRLYVFLLLGPWWLPVSAPIVDKHLLLALIIMPSEPGRPSSLPLSLYLPLKTCPLHKSPSPWLALLTHFPSSLPITQSSSSCFSHCFTCVHLTSSAHKCALPHLTVSAKSYCTHPQGIHVLHSAHWNRCCVCGVLSQVFCPGIPSGLFLFFMP